MKPDWKDAPKWAKYLAMDKDGCWCWFQNKPNTGSDVWCNPAEGGMFEEATSQHGGWKDSLEKRPNAKE